MLATLGVVAAAVAAFRLYSLTAPVEVASAPPPEATIAPDEPQPTASLVASSLPPSGATAQPAGEDDGGDATAEPTAAREATAKPPAATRVPARVYRIDPKRSSASYTVDELFLENNTGATVVGETNAVSGQLRIDRQTPSASRVGEIVVDISQLKSDSERRDNAIRRQWLESAKYPLARFKNATLSGLPARVSDGEPFRFRMTGDMTLHNTTRKVTWAVTATLDGDLLRAEAKTRLKMPLFGVAPPNIAGFVSVEEELDLKLSLVAEAA